MFTTVGLFIGALLDALIGPNLIVPGEPFLMVAGYQLYQGMFSGVIAVFLGGLIGDQISYWIGYHYGAAARRRLLCWKPTLRRPLARAKLLTTKHSVWVLVIARLLGPVAWVVPFVAGTHKIAWRKFTLLASIGLLLGIGQFVFWGYLLAAGVTHIPVLSDLTQIIVEHKYTLGLFALTIFIGVWGWRKKWQKLPLKLALLLGCGFIAINFGHFFGSSTKMAVDTAPKVQPTVALEEIDYRVFAGQSAIYAAQAINIVYLGDNPKSLMGELDWIENRTFTDGQLTFGEYLNLLIKRTPPVSDLHWNGVPQDLAFQQAGTLTKRSHIRWWNVGREMESGKTVWLGAISYDNGLKVTPYNGIVTILHSIDPDVDLERDRLKETILTLTGDWNVETRAMSQPSAINLQHDYYTDGDILMVSKNKTAMPVAQL